MRKTILMVGLFMFIFISCLYAFDDPDLTFYFPFEAFDGDTALDKSGKGHNGTINGNIKIVDGGGKIGNAAEFEQTSFIDLDGANFPLEDIPVEEMTLMAWIKPENTGGDHAIFNARSGDSTWLIHPEAKSSGQFRWLLRAAGGNTIFDMKLGTVVWDEWQHYAGVYDGDNGILYINGQKEGEMAGGADISPDWAQGARIGYNIDNNRPFTGVMDEISLWKRALTLDEITAIMNNGLEDFMAVNPAESLSTTWGKIKSF
ncbi:hypothetical protein GF312_21130 [Candidatus Poribacteria bacterium]|nr:hypothetical protein [Candidatus Poribacteria bacterium]